MNKNVMNSLLVLGLSYIAGFLFSGFLAATDTVQIVSSFGYQRFMSLMTEEFIHLIPTMHITAILISFSLFFMTGRLSGDSFLSVLRVFVILLIMFMLLYLVLSEVILPGAIQNRQVAENESRIALMYKDAGDAAFNANNNAAAMDYYHRYLDIDPGNQEVFDKFEELRKSYASAAFTEDESSSNFLETQNDSDSYLAKAYSFYTDEDYLSAYYYADLAYRGNRGLDEAKRIRDESYAFIYEEKELVSEKNERAFFSHKAQAFRSYQNKDFEDAYYRMKSLEREGQLDRDVKLYLESSRSMIEETGFFISELSNMSFLIPVYDVTFLNRKADAFSEIVYAERVIYTAQGIYLFDVELMHLDSENRVIHHQRNPYGKVIGDMLSLHCLDDNYSTITYDAEVLRGDSPVSILPLKLQAKDFPFFSLSSDGYTTRPFPDLFKSLSLLPQFGYSLDELHVEFINRVLRPFVFIVLSFAAMALGYSLRSRYIDRPPLSSMLLMVGVPFMVNPLMSIGAEISNQLIEKSSSNLGFVLTIVIASGLLIVLFIASMLWLVRSMVRKK